MQEIEPPSHDHPSNLRPLSVFTPLSVLPSSPLYPVFSVHGDPGLALSVPSSAGRRFLSLFRAFYGGEPSPGRGYSVLRVFHAHLHAYTHTLAARGNLCVWIHAGRGARTNELYVSRGCSCARLWSRVGLCKSVRYLDTRKGVRKGARTRSVPLSFRSPCLFYAHSTRLTHPEPPLDRAGGPGIGVAGRFGGG